MSVSYLIGAVQLGFREAVVRTRLDGADLNRSLAALASEVSHADKPAQRCLGKPYLRPAVVLANRARQCSAATAMRPFIWLEFVDPQLFVRHAFARWSSRRPSALTIVAHQSEALRRSGSRRHVRATLPVRRGRLPWICRPGARSTRFRRSRPAEVHRRSA